MVPNPMKMDDLGVPLFLETPIVSSTNRPEGFGHLSFIRSVCFYDDPQI